MDTIEENKNIEGIDEEILKLFTKRMSSIDFKDSPEAERQLISEIFDKSAEEVKDYTPLLFMLINDMCRSYRNRVNGINSELTSEISNAIENTPKLFPENAIIACQGTEGSNSQIACDKLFRYSKIKYYQSFESVFASIQNGICNYGVIPLENSTAGSVNAVYDLMMKYHFNIVRSLRLKIDHNLLVKPGTKLKDIKEIYSHEQAINQCSKYLGELENVNVIACENTAIAARMVAESDRNDIAAIASKQCIKNYGLDCVEESIQNNSNNYTRFICISKDLEIYPGADRTSIMLTLPHKPGALYEILANFYTLGINLNKLESRPIPGRDFEFMFYFDLETPVYSPRLIQLIGELSGENESFRYLGSYNEII